MGGDSESASKNTSISILKCRKYSNVRILENLLASELVLAYLNTLKKAGWKFMKTRKTERVIAMRAILGSVLL